MVKSAVSFTRSYRFSARSHTDCSEHLREPAAEFLGVLILIVFGNGVDCQVVLSGANTAVASSGKGVSPLHTSYIPATWLTRSPGPGLPLTQLCLGSR